MWPAGAGSGACSTFRHATDGPVDFQNPTEQDFEQFCSMMEQLKKLPVHVHCIANYRVSAFFYRYRRDVLGTDET
jgi:hypothetical protein